MKSLLHLVPCLHIISSLSLVLSERSPIINSLVPHSRRADYFSSSPNTTCASLHMIVARASLEAPGEGIIGSVVTQVESSIPGSDSEAVIYPATLDNYISSESSGVAGMKSLIISYEARCPRSKIALLGYSQGAQVVGDVLCGTSETSWNSTAPENATLSKNIVASVQMGDPTFDLNQAQDVGNATKGGIFKRNNTAACPSSIMKSYCNFNDTFCDSGSSLVVHLSYVKVYGDVAAQWIVGKFVAENGTNATSGGGTHTSTSSGAGSTSTSNASRADGLGKPHISLTAVLGFVMFLVYI